MSEFWRGVIRVAIKAGWASLAVWLIAHHINAPAQLSTYATDLTVAAIFFGVSAAIHFLETRTGDSAGAKACRAVAKLLMLWAAWKPVYAVARVNESRPPHAVNPPPAPASAR